MKRKSSRLSLSDWQTVYEMKVRGESNQRISKELGYHKSSIGRALKRIGPRTRGERNLPWQEKAKLSYDRDQARKAKKRKRFRIPDAGIRIFIHENIKTMTPELLSGRMKLKLGRTVCAETIYQYIYQEARELIVYLPPAGQGKRRRRGSGRNSRPKKPAAPKRSIEPRREEVNKRVRPGDCEVDTAHSKRGSVEKAAVLTVIDREGRYRNYESLPNLEAESLKAGVLQVLKALPPQLRQTITLDNGPENALQHSTGR